MTVIEHNMASETADHETLEFLRIFIRLHRSALAKAKPLLAEWLSRTGACPMCYRNNGEHEEHCRLKIALAAISELGI